MIHSIQKEKALIGTSAEIFKGAKIMKSNYWKANSRIGCVISNLENENVRRTLFKNLSA